MRRQDKITLEELYKALINLNTYTDKYNVSKLFKYSMCERDKIYILNAVNFRDITNEYRGVNQLNQYQRRNKAQNDLKAMIGEVCLGKLLWQIMVNNMNEHNYLLTIPAIAELILNRKKQDFLMEDLLNNTGITFDVKSQFLNNDFNYVCVNEEAFKSLSKNANFFVLALIDGKQDDFKSNNEVVFYAVNNKFFIDNSEYVYKEMKQGYYKLQITKILGEIK